MGRNDLKNIFFRMHKNFKNEIFYTRLRKFKQRQKNFKIFMRGYENLNKFRKMENLYARLRKFKQGKQQFKINFGWLR